MIPFRFVSLFCLTFGLIACGGGSNNGSDSVTITTTPNQPDNVVASSGTNEIILSWDTVSDAIAYKICQALESVDDVSSCYAYDGGVIYQGITTNTYTISSLAYGVKYYFTVVAVNSDDNEGTSSVEISAVTGQVFPSSTGILNDTGITTCSDYADGNSDNHDYGIDCSSADDDLDPVPPGQDALYGRDYDNNDDSDGHAGFSFTKLDENGVALEASASSWSCVKDNVTGFIWEVKTDDDGLYDKDHTYGWYDSDSTTNGGDAGDLSQYQPTACYGYDVDDATTYCNTEAYITRVNETELCGTDDWRLPGYKDLLTIVDLSSDEPTIDTDYFPNTQSEYESYYWTSSSRGSTSGVVIDMSDGRKDTRTKQNQAYNYVRLVSGN